VLAKFAEHDAQGLGGLFQLTCSSCMSDAELGVLPMGPERLLRVAIAVQREGLFLLLGLPDAALR